MRVDGEEIIITVENAEKAINNAVVNTLDKIRAEIVDLADADAYGDYQQGFNFGLMRAVQIIDKCKESGG